MRKRKKDKTAARGTKTKKTKMQMTTHCLAQNFSASIPLIIRKRLQREYIHNKSHI